MQIKDNEGQFVKTDAQGTNTRIRAEGGRRGWMSGRIVLAFPVIERDLRVLERADPGTG
jgi:hypothetical protein